MLKSKKLRFVVFLIISILLLRITFVLPKDELIIDDFEDNDASDWDESGFGTVSYKVTDIEPKGRVADIEIFVKSSNVLCQQDNPPAYCNYGSFQKTINKNFKGFSKISYWIKFSDYCGNIDRISLSLGDVVSGRNQTNKANYFYKPGTNDWQFVSFDLSKPDDIIGNLNLKSIKKIRFNIEYGQDFYKQKFDLCINGKLCSDLNIASSGEDFYEEAHIFHVYIDDVRLIRYSNLSIVLFILSIIFLVWALINLFNVDIKKKLNRFNGVICSLLRKKERKKTIKIILNSTFQFLLVIFLFFLLMDEFYSIQLINYNYFLVIILIFGALAVPPQSKEEVKHQKIIKQDYSFIIFLGILGTLFIYVKTKELGILGYLISIMSGILIILLSYLILRDGKNEK